MEWIRCSLSSASSEAMLKQNTYKPIGVLVSGTGEASVSMALKIRNVAIRIDKRFLARLAALEVLRKNKS